jgi:hypothetical protein
MPAHCEILIIFFDGIFIRARLEVDDGNNIGVSHAHASPNAEHRTLNAEHWTLNTERWTLNAERWTLNTERWTLNAERWTLNAEHWTLNAEHWTLNAEHWTLTTEHWTGIKHGKCTIRALQRFIRIRMHFFAMSDVWNNYKIVIGITPGTYLGQGRVKRV